jgi:glutathione S-transferase
MYTLIGAPKTRAFRVMWMLAELDQPYEHIPAPPGGEKAKEVNPTGKIPVLMDGGAPVIDSAAICQYLADKHGRHTFPAGTIERARQDSFMFFANDDAESSLWVAFKHTVILPKELQVPDVVKACHHDFDRAMTAFSERLGSNDYVMGNTFTVPDVILGHVLGWALNVKFAVPQDNVNAYLKRLRDRPGYKAAAAKRDAA